MMVTHGYYVEIFDKEILTDWTTEWFSASDAIKFWNHTTETFKDKILFKVISVTDMGNIIIIAEDVMETDPAKVKAILKKPEPTDKEYKYCPEQSTSKHV